MVAAGIFLSRIAGLIRERAFAHYFGNSDAGDAFKAALKIPNFLQNLFGEGVLSASFIPVYAKLVSGDEKEEAGRVASSIATLLALFTSVMVLLGVVFASSMIDVIAPGFEGEKRALTIRLVQIFFPGTGLLVMSAWCLGILNSHHKFFLSYAAPVIWNVAIIASLIFFGDKNDQPHLAIWVAWGLVAGSALQFIIQLPVALGLVSKFKPAFNLALKSVRDVIKNFMPVVVSRGVVQISSYIDNVLASLLPTGAVSALAYAQVLYLLPVSLFGMSISAAQLPEMSRSQGTDAEVSFKIQSHLNRGLSQIAFFIVPSVVAFLGLGDVIVAALFQTGEFNHQNATTVWGVLAGSTVGLLASTMGRLYSSAFYAFRDTRTPLKFAFIRVVVTTILGYLFAITLPPLIGLDRSWGTAGLTASAGIAGWIEFYFLRKSLNRKIGQSGLKLSLTVKLWFCALVALGAAWGIKVIVGDVHPIVLASLVLTPYGLSYLLIAKFFKITEADLFFNKLLRKK